MALNENAAKEIDIQNESLWTPNKVNIERILLIGFDSLTNTPQSKGMELAPFIASVEIDQSIFSPTISMRINIGSPIGLTEHFSKIGMQGQEFVVVEFNTKARRSFKMAFFVTHIQTANDPLDQITGMTLNCLSIEKLYNDTSTVNKSFNSTPSQVAKKIFDNKIAKNPIATKLKTVLNTTSDLLETPSLEVLLQSDEDLDFIIPGLTPYEAINFCARRCLSNKYKSSYFTFYQTSKGFRFDSIEARIKKGKEIIDEFTNAAKQAKGEVDPTGLFFTNQHDAPLHMNFLSKSLNRNIKSMSVIDRPNTISRINEGAFFNKTRAIDLYGKNYTDTEFKIRNKYNGFERLGEHYSLSNDFVETICENEEYDIQYFKDSTRRNQNFEKVIGHRLGYQDLLTTYGLNIVVPGDSEMVPGDVIWVDLGEANLARGGTGGAPLGESLFSQLWLVVGHKIMFDQGEITSTLTIVKDGLAEVSRGTA